MRKILAAILAAALTIPLFGCADAGTGPSSRAPGTGSDAGIDVQENGDEVIEISIPLSLFGDDATPELTQEEKDNGFLTKTVTEEAVAYTIPKGKYDAFMEEYKKTVSASLDEMVTGGTYQSVKDIQHTDDFGEITILVDKAAYESSFTDAFITLGAGLSGCMYKAFAAGADPACTVIVQDKDSGAEISRTVYPDALNTSDK